VGGGDGGGLGAIVLAALTTKALPFDQQQPHPISGNGHPLYNASPATIDFANVNVLHSNISN